MLLVVDANILCSALVGGRLTDIFLSPKLQLIAPELLFQELRKHEGELKKKSRLSDEEFDIVFSLLEKRVRVFSLDEFEYCFPRAEELLGDHYKDVPYVALALHLSCSFWTCEKRLLTIKELRVISTEELVRILSA